MFEAFKLKGSRQSSQNSKEMAKTKTNVKVM